MTWQIWNKINNFKCHKILLTVWNVSNEIKITWKIPWDLKSRKTSRWHDIFHKSWNITNDKKSPKCHGKYQISCDFTNYLIKFKIYDISRLIWKVVNVMTNIKWHEKNFEWQEKSQICNIDSISIIKYLKWHENSQIKSKCHRKSQMASNFANQMNNLKLYEKSQIAFLHEVPQMTWNFTNDMTYLKLHISN